ncbi:hypothetical protein DV096_09970 [Bradymonadaceae bacterium TMQ3]|uniref:Uncharacterized protein n=1 Tax=Lujinxingia sediminis TaxID=2480984 RepID=A0ABY0CS84_9DELT|nr:hypothetical protein [Lujinxingia sediminis]RDV38131.1 hypothetical protein DV096_09970 [Bradymonadaceae bacterium TMQ3]RVU43669.1 hypothetical protein EA187_12650 [Lujinxingia sediminis]TXC75802.1 hypothetical protein FRC91_09875 [Bradymonadales bacterium TMQ1]
MDEQEKATLLAICDEQGVDAIDVRVRGAVLVVEPPERGALPSVEVLRGLAATLAERGYRYVTVDLASWTRGGDEQ